MTNPKNAARAGVAAPSNEPQPLNLHDVYRTQAACGYTHDLMIHAHQAQHIAARLRGITAISSILLAASDTEAMHMSEWLHFGLMEAISELASDAARDIERENERAAKREEGAA